MSATAPAMGGNGTLCVFSRVAWIGPMSTTFSRVVYVKPPRQDRTAQRNQDYPNRLVHGASLSGGRGMRDTLTSEFPQRTKMHGVEGGFV